MGSSSSSKAKQRAAEARAKEEAAAKRRQRTINLIIGGVVALVVIGIVGGAFLTSQDNKAIDKPNPDAVQPAGAIPAGDPNEFGIPYNKASGKPVLAIWEDFQCPACGAFEAAFGSTVKAIADQGLAEVIVRSTSFLDANFPGQNSQRAAAAWGCAVDAGKTQEYLSIVYANQPEEEGVGWTDEQLKAFGEQVGIEGEDKATFDQCIADKTYMPWAANGTIAMAENGIGGTPGLVLNGEQLEQEAYASPDALIATIEAAGGSSDADKSDKSNKSNK
jgi:protein-disulfide isomerase